MATTDDPNDITAEIESTLYGQREADRKVDEIYNKISAAFYPLYEIIFSTRSQFTSSLSTKLTKAGRSEPVEVYLSAYLGMGIISGGFIGMLFSILLFDAYQLLLVPSEFQPGAVGSQPTWVEFIIGNVGVGVSVILSVIAITTASIIIMAATTLLIAIKSPESDISNRQKNIDMLLPDAIAFMYCLSTSNMSRVDIMRDLADSEEIYSEVSVEFQRIIHRIDTFSDDYHTAISEVAEETPSDRLSTFLNDLLSTVSTGGEIEPFLETQLELAMGNVEREQKSELDYLESFNHTYITFSLLPIITLIGVSFASAIGAKPFDNPLYIMAVSYLFVGVIQIGSLLIIAKVFTKDYGKGTLTQDRNDNFDFVDDEKANVLSAGVVKEYQGEGIIFDQIYANEIRQRVFEFFKNPVVYIRKKPEYTFLITVPTAIATVVIFLLSGYIEPTQSFLIENGIRSTFGFFYLPLMIITVPFVYFYEINLYRKGTITDGLTADLNKLANTNEKGITLQDSLLITAQDRNTKLAEEFETMYKKSQMKIPLGKSIIEANNKYKIPRLARIFRIIKSAQEVSNNINDVLNTAADLAQTQHNIIQERETRTRNQVAIVGLVFMLFIVALILLTAAIIPQAQDLGVQLGGDISNGANQFSVPIQIGEGVPGGLIRLVSFHGAMIQGMIAGVIVGYIKSGDYKPGVKYGIGFVTIAMAVWAIVPSIIGIVT